MTLSEKIDYQIWLVLEAIEDGRLASPSDNATKVWSYEGYKLFDPHIEIPRFQLLKRTGIDDDRVCTLLKKLEGDGYIKLIYPPEVDPWFRIALSEKFFILFKKLEAKYSGVTHTEPKLRFDSENSILHKDGIDRTAPFEKNSAMFFVLKSVFSVEPLQEINPDDCYELDVITSEKIKNAVKNINARAKKLGISKLLVIDKLSKAISRTQ